MNYARLVGAYPRLLAFGLVLTFFSSFGQTYFIGVFNPSLRDHFGLSHSGLGALYSGATLASSLCLIWVGAWIDRFELRRYAHGVGLGLLFAVVLFSFVSHVWMLPVAFFFLRLFGQGLMGHTSMTTMARYFSSNRGKALSVAGLGFPLGQAVLPRAFVEVEAWAGWRASWWIAAVFVALVLLPFLHWVFARPARGESGQAESRGGKELRAAGTSLAQSPGASSGSNSGLSSGASSGSSSGLSSGANSGARSGSSSAEAPSVSRQEPVSWTRGQVIADPRFCCVLPSIVGPPFIATGLLFHQGVLSESKGWTIEQFTATFVAFAITQTSASLITGPIVDRFRASGVLLTYLLPMLVGLGFLAVGSSPFTAFVFMALFGISAGAQGTVTGAYWVEAYGPAHLGAIRSLALSVMVFATAAAPVLFGRLIDLGVSFETIAWLCCAYGGGATLLSAFSRSPSH